MDVTETSAVYGPAIEQGRAPGLAPGLPWYMKKVYWWAYMRPASLAIFDHVPMVSLILYGNYGRLKRAALAEISPGQRILQAASVYGDLSVALAKRVGAAGALDVIDITPLQVANSARKLRQYPWCRVRLADAASPGTVPYDAVCCFFLLHELPDNYKRAVTGALLASVAPGGKAIFIDYHRPHRLHPLWPLQSMVFRLLEPFAHSLLRREIKDLAPNAGDFTWRKQTCFGGLFQRVVAVRKTADLP